MSRRSLLATLVVLAILIHARGGDGSS